MIEKKIKDVIAKTFNCKIADINKDFSIGSIKSWDSLSHYKLVANLEREFKIQFDDGEPETLTSLRIITSTIKCHYE
jgi:acyl carrier protein